MKRSFLAVAAAAVLTLTAAGGASAYELDLDTGAGFVGKGEVQLAFGLNNQQVQNATVLFEYQAETSQSASWDCYNSVSGQTRDRNNEVTTTTEAVVSSVARVKNQITGYNLTSWSGTPSTSVTTEGQPTGTCPGQNSSLVEGSLVQDEPVRLEGGLYASIDGGVTWVLLP